MPLNLRICKFCKCNNIDNAFHFYFQCERNCTVKEKKMFTWVRLWKSGDSITWNWKKKSKPNRISTGLDSWNLFLKRSTEPRIGDSQTNKLAP